MTLDLVDATFDLQYLALNVGGDITVGGDAITDESVTLTVDNQITVSKEPQDFAGHGTIGWFTVAGQNAWQKITFTGKTAQLPDITAGTTVCVRYNAQFNNMRQFTVPSAIIPAECYAILTAPLFSADSENLTASSKVADLVVEIPRFLLNGSQEFSMDMTGASTSNLTGSALAVYDTASCTDSGYYAKIKEVRYSGNMYDDLQTMAVSDAEITLTSGNTQLLNVIGIYVGGATGSIAASELTFVSDKTSVAKIDSSGKVSAESAGEAVITITLTSRPEIVCYAKVTVTA